MTTVDSLKIVQFMRSITFVRIYCYPLYFSSHPKTVCVCDVCVLTSSTLTDCREEEHYNERGGCSYMVPLLEPFAVRLLLHSTRNNSTRNNAQLNILNYNTVEYENVTKIYTPLRACIIATGWGLTTINSSPRAHSS